MHGVGRRRVLDELDEVVLEHDLAGGHRDVFANLEFLDPGEWRALHGATPVLDQILGPAHEIHAALLKRLAHHLGVRQRKVHAVGYCLGGTLLYIAAAAMARDGDERLASVSFFAAQADFKEAGELMLFIDEPQVSFLEDTMWEKGFLDTKQMAGAFQLLRANDLIWSTGLHQYLMGKRYDMFDLMAWNADATRMPQKMHSQYLRGLFLNNDLAEGRYLVDGKPIHVGDVRAPIFALGTTRDHVAPWKSAYKVNQLANTEVTFVLTNGGHNAGVLSDPGRPKRHYQMATHTPGGRYVAPAAWEASAKKHEGSWWPAWQAWLAERSSGQVKPPTMGHAAAGYAPLADAPGAYVLEP